MNVFRNAVMQFHMVCLLKTLITAIPAKTRSYTVESIPLYTVKYTKRRNSLYIDVQMFHCKL